MLSDLQGGRRVTVGADKAYDTAAAFVAAAREMNVTPHAAQAALSGQFDAAYAAEGRRSRWSFCSGPC